MVLSLRTGWFPIEICEGRHVVRGRVGALHQRESVVDIQNPGISEINM
jgi:hypothetical protein